LSYKRTNWVTKEIISAEKLNNIEEGITDSLNSRVDFWGAVGDNTTDDTDAIQSALDNAKDNGGGTVYVPAGTYLISKALTIYPNVNLKGSGMENTIIHQSSQQAHISGTDISNTTISDISFNGNGSDTGTGGLIFGRENNTTTESLTIENVSINKSGYGINVSIPITSKFTNVRVVDVGGDCFSLYGGGTSTTLTNCYALSCNQIGFNLNQLQYSTLISCVAEYCGIGFFLTNSCNNVSLIDCGCEANIPRQDAGLLGDDYKIDSGVGNRLISCYSRNDNNSAVTITGGYGAIVTGFRHVGSAKVGISTTSDVKGATIVGNSVMSPITIASGSIINTVTTAELPTAGLYDGMSYFDTDKGIPLFYNKGEWFDSAGNSQTKAETTVAPTTVEETTVAPTTVEETTIAPETTLNPSK